MTGTPPSSIDLLVQAAETARHFLERVDAIAGVRQVRHEEGLFQRTLSLEATGGDFLGMLAAIAAAAQTGHEFRLQAAGADEFEITWQPRSGPDLAGNPNFLVDPIERTRLERLIEAGSAQQALELLSDRRFELHATLGFRASDVAWIPSADCLIGALSSDAWMTTIHQLATRLSPDGGLFLVDGLDEKVETPKFTFAAITSLADSVASPGTRSTSVLSPGDDPEALYRATRVQRGWPDAPPPTALMPRSVAPAPGSVLEPDAASQRLTRALISAASSLGWLWLAAEPPEVTPGGVRVRYLGVRDLMLSLTPAVTLPAEEADRALQFWRWATSAGDDPLRADAAQRAITLAVSSADDIVTAAGPALRTARTLHELATRTVLAEAMSARRAARDAAANAARTAATSAREVSGKATERSLALSVAAAGTVFATVQKVLDWRASVAGLVAVALLLIGSLIVALRVDLKSASKGLKAFNTDLDQYRETLSSDDINKVRELEALKNATDDVTRARNATCAVYATAAAAAIALAAALACVQPPS